MVGTRRLDRADLLVLILATIVAVPALAVGFHFDDWWHLAIVRSFPTWTAITGMFRFAGTGGPAPCWWTSPDLKLAFFRPLSALLIAIDDRLFGDHAALWHADQLLWWLLVAFAVTRLLRGTLPPRAAVLAAVAFAIDDAHFLPIAWLANRNALVSASFGIFGVLAHVRSRTGSGRAFAIASPLLLALALLGGESALGVLGFYVAWEVMVAKDPVAVRIRALAPIAGIVALWAIGYRLGGFGTVGSGSYVDPLAQPIAWVQDAPVRAIALLGQLLLRAPVDVWFLAEQLRAWPVSAGIIGVPVWGLLLRRLARDEPEAWDGVKWLLVGSAISMIPSLSTFPSSRLLLLPSIGVCAALGAMIEQVWRARRTKRRLPRLYRLVVFVLAVGALFASPISLIVQENVLRQLAAGVRASAVAADLGPADQLPIVLVAPDPATVLYVPTIRYVLGDPLRGWAVVSMAPHPHRFSRTAANRLEVEVIGGHALGTEWERLLRGDARPLVPGDRVAWGDATIEILEVDAVGPTRFALIAGGDLDDPRARWLVWKDGALQRTSLPKVGESMIVDPAPAGLVR